MQQTGNFARRNNKKSFIYMYVCMYVCSSARLIKMCSKEMRGREKLQQSKAQSNAA